MDDYRLRKVETWNSPSGATLDICHECRLQREESREGWWKDSTGQEYATCSHGGHNGFCDICQPAAIEVIP